jgi:exodeoxyribonuclease VII small subunit
MPESEFEKNFKRLEEIVSILERGNISLDEAIKLYEEGKELAKMCQKKLNEIEKKIEIIEKNDVGEITYKPFEIPQEENK